MKCVSLGEVAETAFGDDCWTDDDGTAWEIVIKDGVAYTLPMVHRPGPGWWETVVWHPEAQP